MNHLNAEISTSKKRSSKNNLFVIIEKSEKKNLNEFYIVEFINRFQITRLRLRIAPCPAND